MTRSGKLGIGLVFLLYLLILTKEILFKYIYIFDYQEWGVLQPSWRSSNFVPFKTITFYLFRADVNPSIIIQNLAGNVIGFIPLGMMLPMFSKSFWRIGRVMATALLLSSTYEIAQLYTGLGSFDVDDLILNTFGGLIGFIIVQFIFWITKPFQKRKGQKK